METLKCSVGKHIGVCGTCKEGITWKQFKPLFTTKHYKAIAEWLKELATSTKLSKNNLEVLVNSLLLLLREDNPNFKYDKFLKLIK